MKKVIFVLGAAGSGKGTNCEKLVEEFGFCHISTGDLIRKEIQRDGPYAAQFNNIITNGNLVPSSLLIELLEYEMNKHLTDTIFLIDGFPRNEENLQIWFEKIGNSVEVISVLFFDCPDDVLLPRLVSRGRSDDTVAAIKKRLAIFHTASKPIINHFEKSGKVHTINSNRSAEEVYASTRAFFMATTN
jgi:UMP-CMP kinase